jgi:hypothetical protein
MELDQIVAPLNIHIVAVVLGILMLAAWQIGRRMGRRLRGTDAAKPSKFDDASVGLPTETPSSRNRVLALYLRDRHRAADWPRAGRRRDYRRCRYGLLHSAGERCGLRHT